MATKSLTTRMTLRIMATYAAAFDLTDVSDPLDQSYALNMANGNADTQANRLYHDSQVVNNTTFEWNLATVTDVFGDVLGWNKLKALCLVNTGTTSTEYVEYVVHDETGTLVSDEVKICTVAGTLTDEVVLQKIHPGGILFIWAPYDGFTIDGTNKNIAVTTVNSADSVTVEIIAIGSV